MLVEAVRRSEVLPAFALLCRVFTTELLWRVFTTELLCSVFTTEQSVRRAISRKRRRTRIEQI